MDTARHPEQEQNNPADHCLLCFAKQSSSNPDEPLVNICGEESPAQDARALVRRYFAEEVPRVDGGAICTPCYRQLDSFHRFWARIRDIQWNHKMRTGEGLERIGLEEHSFHADMTIKEEKKDEAFDSFGSSAEVEGLNNFLNEQFGSQVDHNGNGAMQNRILDSIVNEFRASSINNGDPGECSSSHRYPKRMKRNVGDPWQSKAAPYNQELEFLDEEFYEYDKPPDEPQHQQQTLSPMEELERLRRENELLKQRNHQLVVRLREFHVRNTDLLQINRELTDKLRSCAPSALSKPVPSVQHRSNPTELQQMAPQPPISEPTATTAKQTTTSQRQEPSIAPKFISMSGAYSLDNGDVVVMDSVIPWGRMMDIDATEPGEKFDLKFISKLAVALWGYERLAVSSVTGRKSNNAGSNATPGIQLETEKLNFIKEKVYNRAMLETNDRMQAMARFEDSRVNRLLNIKIQNSKRKKNINVAAM